MKIYIINGPNINLLGVREPEIYGTTTYKELEQQCLQQAHNDGQDLEFMQSNYEGEIVSWIQQATIKNIDVIIINAAAYTHTSIAIHDALKAFSGFIIELHISDPATREPFRHNSYISMVADSQIVGLGVKGYSHALKLLADFTLV